MKVNIYETVDVTDEDRKRISEILGVRQATRDQLKEFVWTHGKNWTVAAGASPTPAETEDLESLI